MHASGIKRSCSQLGNISGHIGSGVVRAGVNNEERRGKSSSLGVLDGLEEESMYLLFCCCRIYAV